MFDDLEVGHSTAVDRVAGELRRALFAGDLPPETPLREVALADATGVARSTVREALGLLVADGLAVRIPNRGVQVKALDAEDVRDVIRARSALECAGIRAARTADSAARSRLSAAADQYAGTAEGATAADAVSEAHLAIHRAIVDLTGSRRLLAAADALAGEIRLGLAHVDRVRGNLAEQVESHRALVAMILTGRVDKAVAELDRHLDGAEASLLATIGRGTIDT
jgi:DNA-binding GntR family transcriptional regulator